MADLAYLTLAPPGGVIAGDYLPLVRPGVVPVIYQIPVPSGGTGTIGATGPAGVGVAGAPGAPGVGITGAAVNASNHLILTRSDGTTLDAGLIASGAGSAGPPGPAGVGIATAAVNGTGHLLLGKTDGTTADAGLVVAPPLAGVPGAAGVGVASASVDGTGHLILTRTDASTVDAGRVTGQPGAASTVAGPVGPVGPAGSGGAVATSLNLVPASGASQALAFAASGDTAYDITLTADCVLTLAGGAAGQLQKVVLVLRQDGIGGHVPALPAGVRWNGGTPPAANTAADQIDVYMFQTPDAGVTILGSF